MEKLLSIIVPAYNVEKYIGVCLDSLINQSVQNHTVILVNDGSKDNTGKICEKYAAEHSDLIKYIDQENRGLGAARNVGMQYVATPFVTFLDSDDWMNTGFVEQFAKLVEETDSAPDMVYTLPWIYDSVTKWITPWYDKEVFERTFEVSDGRSCAVINAERRPELYSLEVNACRKIYRTAFLKDKNFVFPEGLKWEDIPGHFYLLHEANSCMAMPEAAFFYRTNHGGTITSTRGKGRLDMITIFHQLLDVQERCEFKPMEKAYVLQLMVRYSKWSIEETGVDYIDELLTGLHDVYGRVSEEDISFYLSTLCTLEKRGEERGFITCLRSDEYTQLKSYELRENIAKKYSTVGAENKKRLIEAGKHRIHDKGFGYTVKSAVRKFVLKK